MTLKTPENDNKKNNIKNNQDKISSLSLEESGVLGSYEDIISPSNLHFPFDFIHQRLNFFLEVLSYCFNRRNNESFDDSKSRLLMIWKSLIMRVIESSQYSKQQKIKLNKNDNKNDKNNNNNNKNDKKNNQLGKRKRNNKGDGSDDDNDDDENDNENDELKIDSTCLQSIKQLLSFPFSNRLFLYLIFIYLFIPHYYYYYYYYYYYFMLNCFNKFKV